MTINYSVKLSNVKALNLSLNNDTNTAIDPYIKFYFDQNKKFKTETLAKTLNANFKFETSFIYHTKGEKLDGKHFEIEVYDAHIIGADKFVGGFSIDYTNIINGPIHHRIVIRNQGKPNGTVEFDLEMAQLNETLLTIKSIRANFYPGALSPMDAQVEKFLSYSIHDPLKTSSADREKRLLKSKRTTQTTWDDVDQIIVETTLQQLLANPLVFTVHQSRSYNATTDPAYGQANITLRNYVSDISHIGDNCKIGFVEPILHQQMVVGAIEGDVFFHNAPLTCQMLGGVHTDVGIQDGQPFFSQFKPLIDNNNSNRTETVVTASLPKEPEVLPANWEKRVAPDGSIYYVDHATKTSHWSLPTTTVSSTPSVPISISSSVPTSSPISITSQASSLPSILPNQQTVSPTTPNTTPTSTTPVQQIPQQQTIQQPKQQPQQPQQQFIQPIQPIAPTQISAPPKPAPQQLPQPTYIQPGVQLQYTMGAHGQPYAAPSYAPQPPAAVGAPQYYYPQQQQQPGIYPGAYPQQVPQGYAYPTTGYTYAYRYPSSSGSSCHGHHHCH
ncbi:hypothetical protein PPL_11680 [Heterostelium album PN500]|uniref:WW domain-containing protein n=1 Tax=Heterostelium pallidum (strain ATCC 26659 / Pp 5 / PN500) TaxID=670386 RepID=D3BU61_HETP5|nr:hypothetical protein PPL_11680 [Heterostelium album PN500]EFA75062.1 hypothetical protein PPL_11680 [Heterostelium album PN500]|eukprot:XP_020427196.1 hypothetical protein PPL_11680 [Heterostelium album PN500]